MRQSIRGYTDAVIEEISGREQLAGTASEVGAVVHLVDSSEDLRLVLSDSGLSVASRRAVISDLLTGQVGTPTMRLIHFILDADRAVDFRDDLAWLAARLEAAANQLVPVGEPILGRAAAFERIEGFATGVLEAVDRPGLGGIEDDLFRFERLIQASDDLRSALTGRDLAARARRGIVVDLLHSRAAPAATSLAAYATNVGRPRDYIDLLAHLVDRVAAESNRRVAEVQSPVDLDDGQQQELATALSRLAGRSVEVRVTIEPSLLAGFRATLGDTVVDGSARHRLALLKERLIMPEADITIGDHH